jgi:nucleotide-binding universal stress UspA family protein
MFKKILIATDFSEASISAREAAVSLARRGSGRIRAIHVVSHLEQAYQFPNNIVPELEKAARNELEKFFPPKEYPQGDCEVLIGGSVAEEILNYAQMGKYDLIVLGSHGRSAVGRILLGSVTQRIIRNSEIPVMIVKDLKHSSKHYQGFERVLCPTDFSDTSMKCLDLGTQFANFLKADFDLIHVVDVASFKDMNKYYSIPLEENCELNTDLTLRKLIENKKLIGEVRVATLMGEPDREILKYAEENKINFILMASHRKRGLDRILMGSVTASVVARSGIPVITFCPKE